MAAVNKRWWLKLESDFPSSPTMRLIERKFGGGGAWIYIKMMLASLRQQDQEFLCRGSGEDIVDLIAAVIYEDPDEVKAVYDFAVKRGEIEEGENDAGEKYCIMIQAAKLSGGESDSAERVRRSRARKEQAKALQCNGDSLQSNGKALQCNSEALQTGGNKNKSKSNSKSKSKNKSQNESDRESESEKENYSNSESKNYSKTRARARENEPGGSSLEDGREIQPGEPGGDPPKETREQTHWITFQTLLNRDRHRMLKRALEKECDPGKIRDLLNDELNKNKVRLNDSEYEAMEYYICSPVTLITHLKMTEDRDTDTRDH